MGAAAGARNQRAERGEGVTAPDAFPFLHAINGLLTNARRQLLFVDR